MMKNKLFWKIIFALFTLIFIVLILRSPEDSWICTESGWIEHGKPNATKPTISCGSKEKKVEKYLKENISDISPQKEVLGGKFYIIKIDWL